MGLAFHVSIKKRYSLVTFTAEKALFEAVWLWSWVHLKGFSFFVTEMDIFFPLFILLITQSKAILWEKNLHYTNHYSWEKLDKLLCIWGLVSFMVRASLSSYNPVYCKSRAAF